jgi:signal transduction histidine kinase
MRRALLDDNLPQSQQSSSAQQTFVRATLPLAGQDLVSLITIPDNYPDPALARFAASNAAATLLRPIAAAATMHQELFRQSREANIVLSRNLGHDLTNIIATAKLDLAVLRRLLTDDPATLTPRKSELIRTSVAALLDTTRFLQEVVNIYRAFSFLKRPIRESADINELLTTFVAAFRPSVSARVDIQLHLPTEPVRANVEIRLLKLALFNLVQNALDAIKRLPAGPDPEPAEILISLTPPSTHDKKFQITIEDNGPGICGQDGQPLTPAAIPAIFGFGYSTKDREVNEGLGLAWVRTIIEEFHGGTIRAENRSPRGARFIITLPVEGPQ